MADIRMTSPKGVKKRGHPEPESSERSPKKPTRSSDAGPGAAASRGGAAPSDEAMVSPAAYQSPKIRSSSMDIDPSTDVAQPKGDEAKPMSREDAYPAKAAVMSLFAEAVGQNPGTTPQDRADYVEKLITSDQYNFFLKYVIPLMAADRPHSEECFGMVVLLVKKHGRGDTWRHAWPIDVYLERGLSFEGKWDDAILQAEVENWRTRAWDLANMGASRADLGTFSSLLIDAKEMGPLVSFKSPPQVFDLANEGREASVAHYLLQMKQAIWPALFQFYFPELANKGTKVEGKWGKKAIPDITNDFQEMKDSAALGGTERPLTPLQWEFRYSWRLMGARFATGYPSAEAQAQYDGIVQYIEELYKRYEIMQLPLVKKATGPGFDCLKFCDAMWKSLDLALSDAIDKVYKEWQEEFAGITEKEERHEMKMRCAEMLCQIEVAWPYGVKTPACPREHLWRSLEKRLIALEMSAAATAVFRRLKKMAHILAGSGIMVEPPPLLNDVDSREYIFEQLEPAFLEHELAFWGPIWDMAALKDGAKLVERSVLVAAKARIWENARSNNGRVWGPEQESWRLKWQSYRDLFVMPDPSSVLAGRCRDLHQEVETFADIFGEFIVPDAGIDISESSEEEFGKLMASVRRMIRMKAKKLGSNFALVAVNDDEIAAYQIVFERLRNNILEGRPFFSPWNPPPTELENDKDPRARGSGTDRSGLKGTWKFKGSVGKGGFGQVSRWDQVDDHGNILDRLVLKESYTRNWEKPSWWVGDNNLRRPKEYFFAKYVSDLPAGSCIAKPRAYAIYENIQMYRLYLEYCRHGDLYQLLLPYTKEPAKRLGIRIPTRLIWAVFESLATALCLMRDGCLPGGTRGVGASGHTFPGIMHMDVKDMNVFLADVRSDQWPGIPTAKLGDFGLACLEGDEGSEKKYNGTAGYKAPEQIDYERKGIVTRANVDRQPTSTASDVWGVGLVILSLMNTETIKRDGYTYEEGQVLPALTASAKQFHSRELCELVVNCLEELPGDRLDCTEIWTFVKKYVLTLDKASGVALKYKQPVAQDRELLLFKQDLELTFTPRAGDS